MFVPDHFFNLSEFPFSDLFKLKEHVWETLKDLTSYLNSKPLGTIESEIPKGVFIVNPEKVSIEKNVTIEPGAYIEGKCIIGKGSTISHSAYVHPYVLTGKNCVIGHATEVKHSILLDGAHAPHFNYVGDSILGNNVNLGAGVICANFRLDKGEVVVDVDGSRFKTGLRKFGAILGDMSQLGCNTVLNPGILLRKKTLARACSSIQKSNVRNLCDGKPANCS